MPDPIVTVRAVTTQPLPLEQSLPGRTVAYMVSDVRPQVADALVVRAHVDEQLDVQQAYVAAVGRSHELAEARYRSGVVSYLEALEAQRVLYGAQQDFIDLKLQEATNRVTFYKVLGGGAQTEP